MNTLRIAAGLIGLVSSPILFSLPLSAQSSSDTINIVVIEDMSGPIAERGSHAKEAYTNFLQRVDSQGGLAIGPSKYKIRLTIFDSQSRPDVAAARMREAIDKEKARLIVCSNIGCVTPAEETKTPLILTAGATASKETRSSTFLINAPSPEDYKEQTDLAIKVIAEALSRSGQPTTENIIGALRTLNIRGGDGSVRFDKFGNNIGRVVFPVRQTSRPDAAGCSQSCAKTCPSDCGQTKCSTSGANQCCNVCGMPPQN